VTTSLLVVLLLTNDLVTLFLATDRVSTPREPYPERAEAWSARSLLVVATGLAVPLVVLSFGLWIAGSQWPRCGGAADPHRGLTRLLGSRDSLLAT